MDVRTITFDDVNCWESFGVIVKDGSVGFPSKIKNRIQIPNTNIFYDYADIFGDQYSERTLEYTLLLMDSTTNNNDSYSSIISTRMNGIEIQRKKRLLANWLMPGSQHKLQDSLIPGYYFLAEIQNAPTLSDLDTYGELTVQFTCYPYKIGNSIEGLDLWDDFDFDNDVFQQVDFEIPKVKDAFLYNVSIHSISPKIIVDGGVVLGFKNESFTLKTGTYDDIGVVLEVGRNDFSLSGKGDIKFEFRKELL